MDKEPMDSTIDYETGDFEDIAGTPGAAPSSQEVDKSTVLQVQDTMEQNVAKEPAPEENQSSTVEPSEVVAESSPMDAAERAADIAERDAKELEHLKKVLESDDPLPTSHDEQPETQPVDVRQDFIDQMHSPKKKSKMGFGKKTAIAVATILVLGSAGFFVWWFAYYSQTGVVLADALRQFILADSISAGAILETVDDDLGTREMILTSEIHGLTESSHFFVMNTSDSDADSSGLKAEATMLSDGGLYVKVDGLEALGVEASDELGELDDKWYQLEADDISQFFGMGEEAVRPIADFYNCSVAVAGQDYSKELSALYEAHPFLSAQKSDLAAFTSGATTYDLDIDYATLADFLNALPELGVAESFYVCYNTMAESLGRSEISVESFAELDAEDVEQFFPNDFLLQFEIRNFGHELVRVFASWSDNNLQQNLSIDLDYTYHEISSPDEYWTPEDLITVLQDYSPALLGKILSPITNTNNDDMPDRSGSDATVVLDDEPDEDDEDYGYDEENEYIEDTLYEDEDED